MTSPRRRPAAEPPPSLITPAEPRRGTALLLSSAAAVPRPRIRVSGVLGIIGRQSEGLAYTHIPNHDVALGPLSETLHTLCAHHSAHAPRVVRPPPPAHAGTVGTATATGEPTTLFQWVVSANYHPSHNPLNSPLYRVFPRDMHLKTLLDDGSLGP